MKASAREATGSPPTAELDEIIRKVKQLARRYREITGRPLGITGEIGEYEAARLLGLEIAPVRSPGYDLIRRAGDVPDYLQVKTRVVDFEKAGGRLGSIDVSKPWDAVLLVLLTGDYEPIAIYEVPREPIVEAITRPGSKARARGALSLPLFRSLGKRIWSPSSPAHSVAEAVRRRGRRLGRPHGRGPS